MEKLLIKLKLTYYSILTTIEDFLNKLKGDKPNIGIDSPLIQQQRQQQNVKLARGIKKLTERIYNSEGKLNKWAKRKDLNIFNIIPAPKKTSYEKLEEARIIQKILDNPTDSSKTNESMVKHNVSNAPRYELERERRSLNKEKFKAIKSNDIKTAIILDAEIKLLNKQILRMK